MIMLADITRADSIYIVCGKTDMRKQIDGLCAIIEGKLHMGPDDNALFLFCGRRCDRIKAILYEPDGIVLLYKRLSVDGRFRWPRNQDEVRQLTWQQFDWLMSGLEIEQPKAIQRRLPELRNAGKP
jgi:transposase